MKNFSLIIVSVLFMQLHLIAQVRPHPVISPLFFGINGWMPDTSGNGSSCPGAPTIPCILNGKIHSNWQTVKSSMAQIIRYGGIGADENQPTDYQYHRMYDSYNVP